MKLNFVREVKPISQPEKEQEKNPQLIYLVELLKYVKVKLKGLKAKDVKIIKVKNDFRAVRKHIT